MRIRARHSCARAFYHFYHIYHSRTPKQLELNTGPVSQTRSGLLGDAAKTLGYYWAISVLLFLTQEKTGGTQFNSATLHMQHLKFLLRRYDLSIREKPVHRRRIFNLTIYRHASACLLQVRKMTMYDMILCK